MINSSVYTRSIIIIEIISLMITYIYGILGYCMEVCVYVGRVLYSCLLDTMLEPVMVFCMASRAMAVVVILGYCSITFL